MVYRWIYSHSLNPISIIRYEDSGTSKWIRKCLTTTSGEKNTGFQGFEIFMDLLIPNYKMCRKLVQKVEDLIDFLYNFFALMENVDPYIRSYKRHVYSLRPWGFEFRCIKRRVNLMLNVKGSVTFATQKCIGVPSPYTIRTYVTMKNLTYFFIRPLYILTYTYSNFWHT